MKKNIWNISVDLIFVSALSLSHRSVRVSNEQFLRIDFIDHL